MQRVEHAAAGVRKPVEQMPLRSSLNSDYVELVLEAGGERLDRHVATHPGTSKISVVRQVERHRVMTRFEPIGELEHAANAAESTQVRLDESHSKPASNARHGSLGYRSVRHAPEGATLSGGQNAEACTGRWSRS